MADYATKFPTNDVLCVNSDEDMLCEMTTTDGPICINVDTPKKKSSKVKSEHLDDTDKIPKIKSGKYFPIHLFDNMEPEEVEYIRTNIDGMKLY